MSRVRVFRRLISSFQLRKETERALREVFKFNQLSPVQSEVIPKILQNKPDLLVRAKTGTGKTLAFLIPVLQEVLIQEGVQVLILSPTRELALQTLAETEKLLTFSKVSCCPLIGGNSRRQEEVAVKRRQPEILVCTLGRLLHHFETSLGFNLLFKNLKYFILDEADLLLGRASSLQDIHQLTSGFPNERMNLMFSATMTTRIEEVAGRCFRQNFQFLDLQDSEVPTCDTVDQEVFHIEPINVLVSLYNCIFSEIEKNPYRHKIMVFLPTGNLTVFLSRFFAEQLGLAVLEIHSKRDRDLRTLTSKHFDTAKSSILFTSDISSRGMDYENVSLVIQLLAPASRDMYIHRLGRTARFGKSGKGILLLLKEEAKFLNLVHDLPLQICNPEDLTHVNSILVRGIESWQSRHQLLFLAEQAYLSLLHHYKTRQSSLSLDDDQLVQSCNSILISFGYLETPLVPQKLAKKLNLNSKFLLLAETELVLDEDLEKRVESLSNENATLETQRIRRRR